MCAACVAQGITYVGGAVGTLRLMAVRAQTRRARDVPAPSDDVDQREHEAAAADPR